MRKLSFLGLLIALITLASCTPRDISVVLNAGDDIVGVNEEWEDAGCTLNINANYAIEMGILSSDLDLTTPGEYRVVYSEEYASEDYTCLRIVKVVDEEPPVVTLNAGIDTIKVGETWEDAGVVVTDNLATSLDVGVSGTVNSNVAGSYEIIYTVTDDYLNTTIITRIVTVIE